MKSSLDILPEYVPLNPKPRRHPALPEHTNKLGRRKCMRNKDTQRIRGVSQGYQLCIAALHLPYQEESLQKWYLQNPLSRKRYQAHYTTLSAHQVLDSASGDTRWHQSQNPNTLSHHAHWFLLCWIFQASRVGRVSSNTYTKQKAHISYLDSPRSECEGIPCCTVI
jgi:hypothetical protein